MSWALLCSSSKQNDLNKAELLIWAILGFDVPLNSLWIILGYLYMLHIYYKVDKKAKTKQGWGLKLFVGNQDKEKIE